MVPELVSNRTSSTSLAASGAIPRKTAPTTNRPRETLLKRYVCHLNALSVPYQALAESPEYSTLLSRYRLPRPRRATVTDPFGEPREGAAGPRVVPCECTVRLELSGTSYEQTVRVDEDSHIQVTPAARRSWIRTLLELGSMYRETNGWVETIPRVCSVGAHRG